jgi:hypothetical protein
MNAPSNSLAQDQGGAAMKLQKAIKLKQSTLSDYYKGVLGVSRPALRAETEPPIARSDRRIAAGLAKVDRG